MGEIQWMPAIHRWENNYSTQWLNRRRLTMIRSLNVSSIEIIDVIAAGERVQLRDGWHNVVDTTNWSGKIVRSHLDEKIFSNSKILRGFHDLISLHFERIYIYIVFMNYKRIVFYFIIFFYYIFISINIPKFINHINNTYFFVLTDLFEIIHKYIWQSSQSS